MSLVFDCHVHVGRSADWIPEGLELARELADERACAALDGDGPDGPSTVAYLRDQGIDGAIAIPCGRDPVQEGTLEEARRSGGFLRPLVQYDPRSAPDAPKRFESALDAGAVGLKVHPMSHQLPVNDRSLYPLYAIAADRCAPVVVHVGTSVFPGAKMKFCDPLLVDEVAADFPSLDLVCAHAGRGFWTHQVYALTRVRPNVWMELSGLPVRRIPEYFPELDRVADRVLFGSDWPSSPSIQSLVEQYRSLPYEAETIDRLLYRNAQALFGFPDPRDVAPHTPSPPVDAALEGIQTDTR